MIKQSFFSTFIDRVCLVIAQILALDLRVNDIELFQENWNNNNPNPTRMQIHNYRAQLDELNKLGTAGEAWTLPFQLVALLFLPFSLLGLMVYFFSPFFSTLIFITMFFIGSFIIVL